MSMTPQRWDPFRDMMTLRDAVDQLFQQSFVRPDKWPSATGSLMIPLDVAETEDGFVVKASLPGVKPEDVQITVHGDVLTIRAESKAEEERQGENWLVREQRHGTLQRSVTLPAPLNADRAQAECENGIVTLTIPKAEEAKPRRISIGGS